VLGQLAAIAVGHEPRAVADQVHDAGLDPGLGEDGLDRRGEALEPVDAADQDVLEAALFELGRHREPGLGALRGLEPEPGHVAFAVQVDPDRHVAGAVSDRAAVADLHDQAVEKQDRVDVLERPGLPRLDVGEHRVGDPRDRVVATSTR
jgi:hypothetical protein